MTQPTTQQLLILVERAERGRPLTADEAALLRAGVAELEQLRAELGDRDEEARERWIQKQLDETGLKAMDFRNGMAMELEPARELVAHWVGAARAMLGDAPNYSETPIEMEVKVGESPERFAFVLQRVGKLTPHQARQQAEQRAEQLEELLRIAHDTSNRSEAERARAVQRAERAEALLREFVSLANVTHQYPAMGGHDCLGKNLTCSGCALRDKIRAALDEHQEQPATVERQPATEQLVHIGWWCWRGDNHGHLVTSPCRSDNVPLHAPTEWADDMRAVIQRIEDGDDEEEQP